MRNFILILFTFFALACNQANHTNGTDSDIPQINQLDFQKTIDGKKTDLYTLTNKNGVEVKITNYGARIVSVVAPDKDGNKASVVLGFKTLDAYINDKSFQGAIVGRYANRICEGKFSLANKQYQLAKNNAPNSLHGGPKGFYAKVWDAKFSSNTLDLTYVSPDMEEGYPGVLTVNVKYYLTENNELGIEYNASSSQTTVVNLTNHAYFNLAGEGNSDILNQELTIVADQTTPVDSTLIPTGVLASVAGTPFDFNTSTAIGKRINDDNQQLKFGKGYDHNWILRKKQNELELAAKLVDPKSGRMLEVFTTEPALQFYSGNFMDGSLIGLTGKKYAFRTAICLEAQHYPDSPNKANFPSTVLNPNENYHQLTVYKFGVIK